MKANLIEEETWQIQDATKIQSYQTCERKYLFEYVFGWRSNIPNVHLEFGTSWHLAMEELLAKGYNSEGVLSAYDIFNEHYRSVFDETWDDGNKPKTPENAFRALVQYAKRWADDAFDVLHVEVAGSVAIADGKSLHFKTDTICEDERGKFSLEHKTGRYFNSAWAADWRQKFQVGVYTHVLYSMFNPEDVYGIIINGVFLSNAPKLKKDGTPIANARDNEFHRVPVHRNLQSMAAWLSEAIRWYDLIQEDFDRLADSSENDDILTAFPRRTESCTKYGACTFIDYCEHWHNPLRQVDSPPTKFDVNHWDPRKIETIKETVTL